MTIMAIFIRDRKISSALIWIFLLCIFTIVCLTTFNQNTIIVQKFPPNFGLQQAFMKLGVCSGKSYEDVIAKSEAVRQRFIQKREAFIGTKALSQVDPWDQKVVFFWDYFPPTLTCPHTLERIGTIGDGGKWVCGFELLETEQKSEPCVLYSFGVGPDSSFESEVLQRTPCQVFAYDYTVNSTKVTGENIDMSRLTFSKMGLGGKNSTQTYLRTLGEFMRENGHEWIDLLKIDIEGAEYDALDQIMEEFEMLPFGHLNLEVHLKDYVKDGALKKNGEQFEMFHNWWTRLEDKGLRAFNWEVNHYPCTVLKVKPIAHEYSFLNVRMKF